MEQSDEEDWDSDSSDEIQPTDVQAKAIYNTVALHEKLEDFGWTGGADFMETLVVPMAVDAVADQDVDVNDDLARELSFYTQALEGAKQAYATFQQLGVPFMRPPDYYAEMVKTDRHMLHIKDKLLTEQREQEEKDERRKQREAKKYSKEVQAQKVKERNAEKKHAIDSVKKWRKQRQNSGFADDEEGGGPMEGFPISLDDGGGGRGGARGRGRDGGGVKRGGGRPGYQERAPGKKRQMKDKKFGFGGSKKLKKQNDADSSADMSSFRGKGSRGGGGMGRGGKRGGKAQRPGKGRREKMRATKG